MKLFNHHVPMPTLMLMAYEAFAAGVSIYIAGVVRLGFDWQTPPEAAPSPAKAVLFGALTLAGLGAMGLYHTHYQRLSREAVIARIAAGLALAALAQTVLFF